MICAVVTCTEDLQQAQQADLVELRLDLINTHQTSPKELLTYCKKTVIATVREQSEGGAFAGTKDQKIKLYKEAIAAGATYIDIEYRQFESYKRDLASCVPPQVKVILSFHNLRETAEDEIFEVRANMEDLKPDIIKIVTQANSVNDNLLMFWLLKNPAVPTIAFCMGEKGVISRILCTAYGSPFTYAAVNEKNVTAGQITVSDLQQVYHSNTLTHATKVYAVVGKDVTNSCSPVLHNAAYRATGMDAVYLPINSDDLGDFIYFTQQFRMEGFNITAPFKRDLIDAGNIVSKDAESIGAINTVKIQEGKLICTNTDAVGVQKALGAIGGKTVLIIGAGGAARAAAYAVTQNGGKVIITNKTMEKAEAVAKKFEGKVCHLENLPAYDIMINATPVGSDDVSIPLKEEQILPGTKVMDMIYHPKTTPLLTAASAKGCETINGLPMLLHQAVASFIWWTGKEEEREVIETAMRASLHDAP